MAMSLRISRILLALLMLATLPIAAQTTTNAPSSSQSSGGDTTPAKVEVFTGYSWMHLGDTVNGSRSGLPLSLKLKDARNGFAIAPSYFFNRYFGITLDGGGHWGDNYTANEIMLGPVFRMPGEHIQP